LIDQQARSATAIVLDAHSGAVVAMATAPGYDANDVPVVTPRYLPNRAVTDTYEPGSTFKLVTVAGALSDGAVTPQTKFTLPYSITVADKTIHDAHPRGTETLTFPKSSPSPRTSARSRSPSSSDGNAWLTG